MKHDGQHQGGGRGEPGGAGGAGRSNGSDGSDGSDGSGGPGGYAPSREGGGAGSHGLLAPRRAPGPPPTSATPHNSGRRRLRPAGGYRKLASFQVATLIYDATVWFCERFMDPRSRTVDQMVQAARSGRQNIAEGNRFGATSSQTELRLVNTARASLEELLLDYEDYLRHRHLAQWEADDAEAGAVRAVGRRGDLSDMTDRERRALYAPWLEHDDPAIRANAILCLIHQANYLLDQHLAALERAFIEEGGYSEQLAATRMERRRQEVQGVGQGAIPRCPQCSKLMALRTATAGPNAGGQFWGCTGYPTCKGAVDV